MIMITVHTWSEEEEDRDEVKDEDLWRQEAAQFGCRERFHTKDKWKFLLGNSWCSEWHRSLLPPPITQKTSVTAGAELTANTLARDRRPRGGLTHYTIHAVMPAMECNTRFRRTLWRETGNRTSHTMKSFTIKPLFSHVRIYSSRFTIKTYFK